MSWKNAYRGARRDTRRARPPADAPPVFAYRRRASLPAMVNDRARADATPGILPLATDEFAGFSGSGFAAVTMASRGDPASVRLPAHYPTPRRARRPVGIPSKSIDYSPDASEPRPESSPSPRGKENAPRPHRRLDADAERALRDVAAAVQVDSMRVQPAARSKPASASAHVASPLTPAERRSVIAALTPARGEGTDGKDADADARSPLAYSPALAAVVAKAVAGKMLTLEEKGALHRAVELQETRRRAAATGAGASPYDPHTPVAPFNTPDAGAGVGRYPAMTDDRTPSTVASGPAGACALTPSTCASSVVSLPGGNTPVVPSNALARAMAKEAEGRRLTREEREWVDAVDALRAGKMVSRERLEMLERAQRDDTDGDGRCLIEGDARPTRVGAAVTSAPGMGMAGSSTPSIDAIAEKSEAGETLTDAEEAVLNIYLITSPGTRR